MEFSTQIVLAVIILVANLLSGKHGSLHWESVTAIFGWSAAISFVSFLALRMLAHDSAANGNLLFPWNR